jgi:hypothetical protein
MEVKVQLTAVEAVKGQREISAVLRYLIAVRLPLAMFQ